MSTYLLGRCRGGKSRSRRLVESLFVVLLIPMIAVVSVCPFSGSNGSSRYYVVGQLEPSAFYVVFVSYAVGFSGMQMCTRGIPKESARRLCHWLCSHRSPGVDVERCWGSSDTAGISRHPGPRIAGNFLCGILPYAATSRHYPRFLVMCTFLWGSLEVFLLAWWVSFPYLSVMAQGLRRDRFNFRRQQRLEACWRPLL